MRNRFRMRTICSVSVNKEQNAGYGILLLLLLHALVFSFCCHSAPDVAFLFVYIQYLTHLQVQGFVDMQQTVRQILMYGGFGNPKMPGSGTDRCAGFNHVHSQCTGSLLNGICHRLPSDAVCYQNQSMRPAEQICTLTDPYRKDRIIKNYIGEEYP